MSSGLRESRLPSPEPPVVGESGARCLGGDSRRLISRCVWCEVCKPTQ